MRKPGIEVPAEWSVAGIDKVKTYFPALDGVRGLAILIVVLSHGLYPYHNAGGWAVKSLLMVTHFGEFGVPIFFSLSGFLVSLPFWEAKEHGHWMAPGYAAKRFIRIFPSFYLSSLLVALVGYFFLGHNPEYFKECFYWMIGVGAYMADPIEFNSPLWSLIIEIQFYLLLPLLFWSCQKLKSSRTVLLIIAFWIIAGIVSRCILVVTAPGLNAGAMDNRLKGYFSQTDIFAFGILLGYLYYHRRGLNELKRIPYPVLLGGGG